MSDLLRGTRGVGEENRISSWVDFFCALKLTKSRGRSYRNHVTERAELHTVETLSSSAHQQLQRIYTHVQTLPLYDTPQNLWGSTPKNSSVFPTPFEEANPIQPWISLSTRGSFSVRKLFPPELELSIENVCFGAVFHIWFRQGKSLY